jgi:hypothetical protein
MRLLVPALALLALPACANLDRKTRDRRDAPLTFTNHSARDVCALHLAPADARVWGKSWLTDIVRVGDQTTLAVKPGRYMLRAHSCNANETVLVLYDVAIDGSRELVLHEPEAREDPAPGRSAWPVTRWLSEASDWYYPTGMPGPALARRVTLDNTCTRDLRVRLGATETTTVPADSRLRLALPPGTAVTLVDEAHHDLATHNTRATDDHLRIDDTCQTIASR